MESIRQLENSANSSFRFTDTNSCCSQLEKMPSVLNHKPFLAQECESVEKCIAYERLLLQKEILQNPHLEGILCRIERLQQRQIGLRHQQAELLISLRTTKAKFSSTTKAKFSSTAMAKFSSTAMAKFSSTAMAKFSSTTKVRKRARKEGVQVLSGQVVNMPPLETIIKSSEEHNLSDVDLLFDSDDSFYSGDSF